MLKKLEKPPKPIKRNERMHPSGVPAARFEMPQMEILEPSLCRRIIRERQDRDIDKYDEVWNGVYIVPPLANNPHQDLVFGFTGIFGQVVFLEGRGRVHPGANVSDRREGWEHSFRAPDVVVVLNDSPAVDCGTHWFGGPDFLVEIESPRDKTRQKIPFYGQIKVQELLVVGRDSRGLQLYRHDGKTLVLVGESDEKEKRWLTSKVIPLRFRWKSSKAGPRIEIERTDGKAGSWTI